MKKEVVFINGKREGYAVNQCYDTFTVGELIEYLKYNFDEDTPVYINNDNGYTYGSITEDDIYLGKED